MSGFVKAGLKHAPQLSLHYTGSRRREFRKRLPLARPDDRHPRTRLLRQNKPTQLNTA